MSPRSQALGNLELVQKALDSTAIVAITDARGVIRSVNRKFCELSGYSEEELIGQNHRLLKSGYHPQEFYENLWATISSGKTWEGEIKNRAKDGREYWVQTVIVPFRGETGEIQEYVSIRYDITREKEDRENLKSLMDSALEGLLIYDLSGQITWHNEKAPQVLNLEAKDLKGRYVQEIFENSLALFQESTGEIHLRQHLRSLEVTTKSFFRHHHRCYLVVFRDITEKNRLEAQIIQQDRLASVGLLASGLAHEIGTPLGVIRARAELTLMDSQLADKHRDTCRIVIEQIDRVSGLMRSLLALSRQRKEAVLARVSPRHVLEANQQLLAYELNRNEIKIVNELDQNLEVMAVEGSLFQVFLNLLVNAIHAIRDRKLVQPELMGLIQVRGRREGDRIRLEIEDNGGGIAAAHMDRLFRPFFTTKDVGQGTGLGLATSLKIVRSWGGEILVDGGEGRGAIFTLDLPAAKRTS